MVGWLESNVPFQHKYDYIRDEGNHGSHHVFTVHNTANDNGLVLMPPCVRSICHESNQFHTFK